MPHEPAPGDSGPEQEAVDPAVERLREQYRKNRAEYQRKIETGEIDSTPYNFDRLQWFKAMGASIQRKDLGNQAIVLTRQEFESLERIDVVLANGEEESFFADDNAGLPDGEHFRLYPEDLGNL